MKLMKWIIELLVFLSFSLLILYYGEYAMFIILSLSSIIYFLLSYKEKNRHY